MTEHTKRHALRALAQRQLSEAEGAEPATRAEVTTLAANLDRLLVQDDRAAGARRLVLAVAGALGAGGIAWLTYVSQGVAVASSSVDRIDRIEAVTEHNAAAVARLERETRDRLDPMMVTLTRIETRVDTLLRSLDRDRDRE